MLFTKFEGRSCGIDGSPTPLLGASHQCTKSHWDLVCLSVTISPSASPPPAHLPVETASETSFPAQPATAQQTGSIFSSLFCHISKHSGFLWSEPIAYQFWVLQIHILSRQILVQVFSHLLSRAKDNGPSCRPKSLWHCLYYTSTSILSSAQPRAWNEACHTQHVPGKKKLADGLNSLSTQVKIEQETLLSGSSLNISLSLSKSLKMP